MTNRVLLDTSGLAVSKPGVNVLTAANDDLIFNSDWSQLSLLQRQTVIVPTYTTTGSASAGYSYSGPEYAYTKSFSRPPAILFAVKDPTETYWESYACFGSAEIIRVIDEAAGTHAEILTITASASSWSYVISVVAGSTLNPTANVFKNFQIKASIFDYDL